MLKSFWGKETKLSEFKPIWLVVVGCRYGVVTVCHGSSEEEILKHGEMA